MKGFGRTPAARMYSGRDSSMPRASSKRTSAAARLLGEVAAHDERGRRVHDEGDVVGARRLRRRPP